MRAALSLVNPFGLGHHKPASLEIVDDQPGDTPETTPLRTAGSLQSASAKVKPLMYKPRRNTASNAQAPALLRLFFCFFTLFYLLAPTGVHQRKAAA